MNTAYQHLALAEVRPGMILSDVLLDTRGQVLLPQGAVLTAAIIALLPRHGVEMLPIAQTDGAAVQEAPIDSAAVEARQHHLFRKNDSDDQNDWATGILRRYMLDYRLGREIVE